MTILFRGKWRFVEKFWEFATQKTEYFSTDNCNYFPKNCRYTYLHELTKIYNAKKKTDDFSLLRKTADIDGHLQVSASETKTSVEGIDVIGLKYTLRNNVEF